MEAALMSTLTRFSDVTEPPSHTSESVFGMLRTLNSPVNSFQNIPSRPMSPVIPFMIPDSSLLNQYFNLGSDDIRQEHLPNIGTTLKNFVTRQTYEIRNSAEEVVPRLSTLQDLKKHFRDFYVKEAIHVFEFLDRPLNTTLLQAEKVVKRFGRADYNANRVKIKDLVLDLSCNIILDKINAELKIEDDLTPIEQWCETTKNLVKIWKNATSELTLAERNLSNVITMFQDVHKKVQPLMNMPMNEAYGPLMSSMEEYLKNYFEENKIEGIYNDFRSALKKVALLTDMMSYVRFFLNSPSEPFCSICLSEPVSYASVPCGHTMCYACSSRQSITCYVCRAQVKERIKVFFM
jgi:hypothetical protein